MRFNSLQYFNNVIRKSTDRKNRFSLKCATTCVNTMEKSEHIKQMYGAQMAKLGVKIHTLTHYYAQNMPEL